MEGAPSPDDVHPDRRAEPSSEDCRRALWAAATSERTYRRSLRSPVSGIVAKLPQLFALGRVFTASLVEKPGQARAKFPGIGIRKRVAGRRLGPMPQIVKLVAGKLVPGGDAPQAIEHSNNGLTIGS